MPTARRTRCACIIGLLAAATAPSAFGEAYDPLYERLVYEHGDPRSVSTVADVERTVATRSIDYAHLDDRTATGYMAHPAEADGPTPALLVIHERWGLNDSIRAMTRRLAANGYTALAVDLYDGETADTPDQAQALMEQAASNEQRLERNLREGLLYLDVMPSTTDVGSIGWCFGGGWALRTALMMPEVTDAAVVYYGELITEASQLDPLSAPILGHFGSEDATIAPERARQFDSLLDELDKPHQIHLYESAGHAFANPSGTRYAAEPAELAWRRTIDFLGRTLETPDEPADSEPPDDESELASG